MRVEERAFDDGMHELHGSESIHRVGVPDKNIEAKNCEHLNLVGRRTGRAKAAH